MKYDEFKERAHKIDCEVRLGESHGMVRSIDLYADKRSHVPTVSISTQRTGAVNIMTKWALATKETKLKRINELSIAMANTDVEERGELDG